MAALKNSIPLVLAYLFGAMALLGLLFVPFIAQTLTGWVSFLAAVALLLGILNLSTVHLRRLAKGNTYSGALTLSLIAVIILGITDSSGLTEEGVSTVFRNIQAPLEAAMASLLVFFLLFSGIRIVDRRRSWWAVLFIVAVILFLLGKTPMPAILGDIFADLSEFLTVVFVSAGMRGVLIGIALGAIAVALRVLMGTDRPYEK